MLKTIYGIFELIFKECAEIRVPPHIRMSIYDYIIGMERAELIVDFGKEEQLSSIFDYEKAIADCQKNEVLVVLLANNTSAYIVRNLANKRWLYVKNILPWVVLRVDRLMIEHMVQTNEKCVRCGMDTGVPKSTPIERRSNYVKNGGQLCRRCNNEIYGE